MLPFFKDERHPYPHNRASVTQSTTLHALAANAACAKTDVLAEFAERDARRTEHRAAAAVAAMTIGCSRRIVQWRWRHRVDVRPFTKRHFSACCSQRAYFDVRKFYLDKAGVVHIPLKRAMSGSDGAHSQMYWQSGTHSRQSSCGANWGGECAYGSNGSYSG